MIKTPHCLLVASVVFSSVASSQTTYGPRATNCINDTKNLLVVIKVSNAHLSTFTSTEDMALFFKGSRYDLRVIFRELITCSPTSNGVGVVLEFHGWLRTRQEVQGSNSAPVRGTNLILLSRSAKALKKPSLIA
jgi:hypothetical protein